MAENAADDGQAGKLSAEYAWLDGGQPYVACAFYTPNYSQQILSLKSSLEALGINHYIKCYKRAATWEATTRLKPIFIDHCLEKFPNNDIAYLDADAVVRRPLDFFEGLNSDISIAFHPVKVGGTPSLRVSAGTVLVRNTEGGRHFARLWKEAERNCNALSVDEDMIYMAFQDLAGISVAVLPLTYTKIFDRPGENPVVEHFQASRGQFKWRRLLRKMRRIGWIGAGLAAVIAIWTLSQHLTWVP